MYWFSDPDYGKIETSKISDFSYTSSRDISISKMTILYIYSTSLKLCRCVVYSDMYTHIIFWNISTCTFSLSIQRTKPLGDKQLYRTYEGSSKMMNYNLPFIFSNRNITTKTHKYQLKENRNCMS